MRSVLLALLATVGLSLQQETDVTPLCTSLGVIHYKIFPLSTEIKNNYCKAPQNVCFAFEMFSSNDFAKAVIQLKEKLGCYPDKPSDGVQLGVLCNSLRALPDTSKKNLFDLFTKDPKKMAAFKPLLEVMRSEVEEWLAPILEQYC